MKEKTSISLKLFAFLMSFLILVVSLPSYAFATLIRESSNESEQSNSEKTEVIVLEEEKSLRDENVKHFKLSDGSTKAVVYSQAVHYLDENGAWIDIDNALTLNGSEYTTNNKTEIKFANKSGSNGLVSIKDGDYKIDFTPLNTNKVSVVIENPQKNDSRKFEDVSALSNLISKAIYSNVYEGIDLEYILVGNKIKENIVVNEKSDSYTFSFEIKLNKLKAELENNSIILCDYDTGAEIYKIPAPYMQDSNGEYSNDVSYTLTQNSKWKYTLTVTANTDWINNEERVFPVRIDPTVQSGTPVIDTYVSLENNASNFASGALLLGNAFGYPDSRIFVKVNSLPTIPNGTALIDAKLSMQVNVLGAFDVGVFKATGNWTTGVTHSSAPNYINANSPLDIVTISQSGRTLWDITKLYKEWMNGATNNGVCLKGINIEGASSAIGAIVQACESTNYYVPNIEVTYVSMTGLEDYYSYYTSSAGSAGVGYVNGFTGNLTLVHPVTTTADEIMPFGLGITYNSNLGAWKLNIYESIECQVISGYQHFKWTDADGTEHWFAPVLKRDLLGLFAPYQYNENGELEEVITPTEFYDQDGLGLKLTYTQEGVYTISDDKGNSKVIANGLVVQISDQFGNVRKIEEQSDESIFVSLLPNGMTNPIVQLEIELITNGYTVLNRQTLEKVYVYYANGVISTIEHYQNTYKYASATYTYSEGKLKKAYDTISNIGIEYTYTNGKVTQISQFVEKENETLLGNAVGISYTNLASLYRTAGKDNVLGNNDDVFNKYVYDKRGRVVTAYSYDFNGNILGASNYDYTDMYEQEDVGAKQNNRLSSTATTGANAINLLQNLDLEDLYAWEKNNIANICTYSYPEDKYGFANGMVHKLTTPSFGTYTQGVDLSAGVYTLSLSVCENLFDTDHFALCVYDGSNNIVKMTDNLYLGVANNGKWSRESLTFEITTKGTYYVGVNMGVNSSSSYVYIDNAMLETGGGASPFSFYEDGSFTTDNETAFRTNATKGDNAGMMGSAGISLNSNLANQSRYKTTHFLDPNKVVQTVAFSTWAKATNAVASSNLSNSPSRFGIGITVTFQKMGSGESSYSTYKTETIFVPAEPSATDWQHLCKVITIAQDQQYYVYAYKQIKLEVSLVYDYNVGSAYFDNASLTFDGTQSKYDYNEMGYIKSTIDQNGNKTQYEYETNKVDLKKVTDSQGRKQEYAYGNNHVVNASGYLGSSSTDEFYHRNAFGQIEWTTEGTDSINDTISTTSYYSGILDSSEAYFTKPSEIMDYNARSTYYTYDEYGRVLGIADETLASNGEYNAIKYIYNSYGELIGAVPATYDKQDNVLTEVTGGKRVDYTYNGKHILSEIISPSTEYNMVYNDFNAIDQILIGNTAIATYEYVQNNGNLKKTTLANGAYIEYTYDSVDRLVGVCYNGIEEARFVYSSSGSLSSIVDIDNSTTYSYYYSGAGKLISERMSNANGLISQRSYEYDVHDRLSKRCVIYFDAEYSKEQIEEYYYNTDGNVERIVRGERNECGLEYTYDGLGRLSTQVKKGSDFLTTQYEYANLDTHVSSIITKTTTNGETTSYDYDKAGNITSITLPTGEIITYTYDNTSQLIREDNEPIGKSYKYNYDGAGNLTSVEEYAYTVKSTALSGTPTSTYAYTYGNSNWGDLLTKYRGVSNTYDQLGNPLSYFNGRRYYFTWDEGRQLASTTLSGSTFTYKYNQDGIRVEKIANGVKHSYYLNGTQIEREVQTNVTTGELIYDLRYYYDIMGIASHIEIYDSIGTRIKFTLETNIQGDVVAIYTDTLTKVASYQYDAWGNCTVLGSNGTENTNAGFIGNLNPFRYRGYYYDKETKLYYLNSRYYDPQVKRFINADEYAATGQGFTGNNMFAYCGNNPVVRVDSIGSAWNDIFRKVAHTVNDALLSLGIDTAALGAGFLWMTSRENRANGTEGIYSALFICPQMLFGYNDLYDVAFDIGTDMDADKFEFSYGDMDYVFWIWKGDYLNLGAGAEIGIYYGGGPHWYSYPTSAMYMQINLYIDGKPAGTVVGTEWWQTIFNSNYLKVDASRISVEYILDFHNGGMYYAFKNSERAKDWYFCDYAMTAYYRFG